MGIKKELEDHLRLWRAELVKVVASKQMWLPDRFAKEQDGTGEQYLLQEPICFGSLPFGSGNCRKEGRVWAFIDGYFDTSNAQKQDDLTKFGASIVFFEAKPRARRFRLIDAFSFDFHVQENGKTSPHPLFHTQRYIRWDQARWQKSLDRGQFDDARDYRFPNFHDGIRSSLFKMSRFRVPTARLDLFAVVLATVADMVIKHDVKEHREAFDRLVDLTQGPANPLHKLASSQAALPVCFDRSHSSAGIWYPLYREFPLAGK